MLKKVKSLFCLFCNTVTFHRSFPALMLPNSRFPLQISMVDYLEAKLCFAHNLIQLQDYRKMPRRASISLLERKDSGKLINTRHQNLKWFPAIRC